VSGFVPGIELSHAFYDEVVAPLVEVPHSAALVGWGSEVLGFDTPRSTDHGWGPRLQVFVELDDVPRVRQTIDDALPAVFQGWPTRFGWDDVPVSHHVQVSTLRAWFLGHLGFDPCDGIGVWDWLATPQQVLLEVTEGAVFHDERGDLAAVRKALSWYPDDVWLWMLACQWRRVDQEEPFVGRAAETGDDLGSRIIATRLVREVMRLCFLLERHYAPYSKWLGSAFTRLQASEVLSESLHDALAATDYPAREAALVQSAQRLAGLHTPSASHARWTKASVSFIHDRIACSVPRASSTLALTRCPIRPLSRFP
jgi:hypothetical protein